MKKNIYSPDEFMSSLYGKFKAEPYKDASTYEDTLAVGKEIRDKTKELFNIGKICDFTKKAELTEAGKVLDYPEYTLKKYELKICEGLISPVFMLIPKNITDNAKGVVALCGHGYGVRQILGISKKRNKKRGDFTVAPQDRMHYFLLDRRQMFIFSASALS